MATYSIPDLLGGELVLGRSMNKGGALAELVREGLPVKALLLLAERLDLRQAEISEKIGIPKRTLTRRLTQHSRLTAAESDRAVRLAQVYSNAAETLGSGEKAAAWLKTPNRALRGGRPLDQLDTDPGVREVEDVLGRIAYGVYS
jgi:putative toxin-antitoxin system antitoxin component (TIGR02293 family)